MDILWLHDAACGDTKLVGAKAANLCRAASSACVPPGFCITTAAWARWAHTAATEDMRLTVAAAYRRLGELCLATGPPVAVRSSGVEEDDGEASFAGQYASFLNVAGSEAVVTAIRDCWASALDPRVRAYRSARDREVTGAPVAVLVQQLVAADQSAVVFSANPNRSAPDEIVVNSCLGLGESIASGKTTPDTHIVRKSDWTIAGRRIGTKEYMTVLAPNGVREVPAPRVMRSRPAIEDAKVIELARLAQGMEEKMGWPVDIECAFHGNRLFLLQCRPITTLRRPE